MPGGDLVRVRLSTSGLNRHANDRMRNHKGHEGIARNSWITFRLSPNFREKLVLAQAHPDSSPTPQAAIRMVAYGPRKEARAIIARAPFFGALQDSGGLTDHLGLGLCWWRGTLGRFCGRGSSSGRTA